jgi:hypothetical protein
VNRRSRAFGALAALGAAALLAAAEEPGTIVVPEHDVGIDALPARREAQLRARAGYGVVTDFSFTDRREESGITFRHHIVDDAGRHLKATHYDHGNGIAAADVDGDGLTDLYFVDQLGGSELWRSLGGGRFQNVTAEAGVGLADRVGVTASFGDVDNDGDPDLYVTTVKMGNVLFENDGRGVFRDVSAAAGVGWVGHSSGAVFFDYDRDSRLDLFVVNVGEYTSSQRGRGGYFIAHPDAFQSHLRPERADRGVLYRNLGGGRFETVPGAAGIDDDGWDGDASITDLNGDRLPDLYVTNMQGDDHYYENQGGRSFRDRTAALFPETPWGAMGLAFFDWNGDGLVDLYVTDMHSDMAVEVGPDEESRKSTPPDPESHYAGSADNVLGNAFYQGVPGGGFREVSDAIGAETYWPWGVSLGDLNADGWEDVVVCAGMNYPFRYGINTVLLNQRGERFLPAEFILGVEPRAGGSRTPWFELECSDLDSANALCEGRAGRQVVMGTRGTRSAVVFDLDADGDLDIVTNEFGAEPQVLASDLAQRRTIRWLEIELEGAVSNRDGLGAAVTVEAGGRRLWKYRDGKSGYLSHSLLPLYFGLGDAAAVDRVTVAWPSGATQTVAGPLASNRRLRIVEPPSPAATPPAAR